MIRQQGLTTVELIVTLFVASLFIMSGYQLYGVVNMRSSNARMMSEASSIGYEALRKYGTYQSTARMCNQSSHESQNVTLANLGIPSGSVSLPNLSITVQRCQPFANSPIIRFTATVKYDSPQREVVHATYISR